MVSTAGYVKNLETGDVEAVIAGEQASLLNMIAHSFDGPSLADVVNIIQSLSNIEQSFITFEILR